MKTSALEPRMSGLAGAPKLVRVKELEVSFEKSRTSLMLIALNCSREIIVTLRGVSRTLPCVPNTELNGRDVGMMFFSSGTSLT